MIGVVCSSVAFPSFAASSLIHEQVGSRPPHSQAAPPTVTSLDALLSRCLKAFWHPEHGNRPLSAPERMYSALAASGAFFTHTPPPPGPMQPSPIPSQTEIEVLFRSWWSLSYPTPPGVHAINTHIGFAHWLLHENAKTKA